MPKRKLNEFFTEGMHLDVTKVDDTREITSYWLAELGELGGTMKKSDKGALKAFITKFTDEFRTPYGRKAKNTLEQVSLLKK